MTSPRTARIGWGLVGALLALTLYVVWDNWGDTWLARPSPAASAAKVSPGGAADPVDTLTAIERGQYLARAGNCVACHSARGATPMAGGRRIETPFGAVFSSNLTPDAATGLGTWTTDDFWQALHRGRSKDGRLLAPAFPYQHTSVISRADSDDLLAWLQSLPPVEQAQAPHTSQARALGPS